jgi:hypothetical protein
VSRATAAWGGVLCRPWTAVLSAQVRNRDVNDPGSGARVRPHARPGGRSRLGSACQCSRCRCGAAASSSRAVARCVCVQDAVRVSSARNARLTASGERAMWTANVPLTTPRSSRTSRSRPTLTNPGRSHRMSCPSAGAFLDGISRATRRVGETAINAVLYGNDLDFPTRRPDAGLRDDLPASQGSGASRNSGSSSWRRRMTTRTNRTKVIRCRRQRSTSSRAQQCLPRSSGSGRNCAWRMRVRARRRWAGHRLRRCARTGRCTGAIQAVGRRRQAPLTSSLIPA